MEQTIRVDPRKKNTVIIIHKILLFHRNQGEQSNLMCLLHLEKLLYITLDYLDEYVNFYKCTPAQALEQIPFNFTQEFQEFIQTVNKTTMEAFNTNGSDDQINLIIKAVDFLMTKSLAKYVVPVQILGQCKVVTFNNLACIYKRKNKVQLALRSVNFAQQIEQRLLNDQFGSAEQSILSTLLNKVAILSQSNKHDKAIEILNDIIARVAKMEKDKEKQQQQQEQPSPEMNSLDNIKLITYYNLGVENEYLYFSERAIVNYKIARQLAQEQKNGEVALKVEEALKKFNVK